MCKPASLKHDTHFLKLMIYCFILVLVNTSCKDQFRFPPSWLKKLGAWYFVSLHAFYIPCNKVGGGSWGVGGEGRGYTGIIMSVCLALSRKYLLNCLKFVTKLGIVVHHHGAWSNAEKLGCYLQGQGESFI